MGTFLIAGFCVLISSIFGPSELGISGAALRAGEWPRLLGFMFVHQGAEHLLINLVALILAGAIAHEVGLSNVAFLAVFFSVGILSALPVLPFTSSMLVGASTGIYGIFGAIAVKLGDYGTSLPKVVGLLGLAIIGSSFIETFLLQASETVLRISVHLAALFLGAAFFTMAKKLLVRK